MTEKTAPRIADLGSSAAFWLKLAAGTLLGAASLAGAVLLGGFVQPLIEKIGEDEGWFGTAGGRQEPAIRLLQTLVSDPLFSYSFTAGCAALIGALYVRWFMGTLRDDGPDSRFRVTSPADLVSVMQLPILGFTLRDRGITLLSVGVDRKSASFETSSQMAGMLERWTPSLPGRVLAFTGDRPGAGKSTAVMGTARALSRYGKKVLILDCDLRNPTMHRATDAHSSSIMAFLLSGDEAPLKPVTDPESDVQIVTVGMEMEDPAGSMFKGLGKLVERVRPEFDYVLLDSPPLAFAEVLTLVNVSDGFVFVVEHGANLRAARLVLDRVRQFCETPGSLVMTKVPAKGTGASEWGVYAYDYGYDYAYGYGHGRTKPERRTTERLGTLAAVSKSWRR